MDFLASIYLWLKAGHVIFVIFWMAGLFMLPRFFVYHQEAAPDSPENAIWTDREGKLLRIILWPSLVVSWVLGLLIAVRIVLGWCIAVEIEGCWPWQVRRARGGMEVSSNQ